MPSREDGSITEPSLQALHFVDLEEHPCPPLQLLADLDRFVTNLRLLHKLGANRSRCTPPQGGVQFMSKFGGTIVAAAGEARCRCCSWSRGDAATEEAMSCGGEILLLLWRLGAAALGHEVLLLPGRRRAGAARSCCWGIHSLLGSPLAAGESTCWRRRPSRGGDPLGAATSWGRQPAGGGNLLGALTCSWRRSVAGAVADGGVLSSCRF